MLANIKSVFCRSYDTFLALKLFFGPLVVYIVQLGLSYPCHNLAINSCSSVIHRRQSSIGGNSQISDIESYQLQKGYAQLKIAFRTGIDWNKSLTNRKLGICNGFLLLFKEYLSRECALVEINILQTIPPGLYHKCIQKSTYPIIYPS